MAADPAAASAVTLMIGMITPGTMATATCQSLIALTQSLQERGAPFAFVTHQGPDVVMGRNKLMSRFLTVRTFSHLLMVDSDMVFEPAAFWRLLSHGEDFTAVAYPQKYYDWTDLQNRLDRQADRPDDEQAPLQVLMSRSFDYTHQRAGFDGTEWQPDSRDGFITVPAVGPGLALIRRTVPETMAARGVAPAYPAMGRLPGYAGLDWHDFFSHLGSADGGLHYAEDQSFCHRWVVGCGGTIWLDVETVVPHIGPHLYRGRYRDRLPEDFPGLTDSGTEPG